MRSGEIQQYSTPQEMVSSPSNDFVGQFVLQKNILPIELIDDSYSISISKLNLSIDTSISSNSVCMFDKNTITIKPCLNGIFTVVSKEYRINHYLYTIISGGFKLRSEMNLESPLSIGDKCAVETVKGKNFLILPEMITSNF